MNYYERYCGDYQRDTAHLSLLEHGAYTQLLDTYYATETPLPADMARLYRVCRAVTADEQAAVGYVVEQFFSVGPDGLRHNTRADAEIEKAQKRIAVARANGQGGGRPPKPSGLQKGNPTGNPEETQRQSSPDPMHQSLSVPSVQREPRAGTAGDSVVSSETKAGEACRLMKAAGVQAVNPSDGELLELLASGVTPRQLGDLAAELLESKGQGIKGRYVIATMRGRLRDAAAAPPAPKVAAGAPPAAAGWQRDDKALEAMGRHLGMQARPGEDWQSFRSRVGKAVADRAREAA